MNRHCSFWILSAFLFVIQFTRLLALCANSQICLEAQPANRNLALFYNGSDFPDLRYHFNISLDTVETLKLHGTKIKSISSSDLAMLPNLKRLYIDGNKELELLDYVFQNSKILSVIHINNCDIKQFRALAFDGAFQKKFINGQLNLNRNKLTYFPIFSSRAPGLKKFYLDYNPITRITKSSLQNLDDIEFLSLKSTPLRLIENDAFGRSEHLINFTTVGSEALSEIGENAFRGAKSLRYLDLRNSAITDLPSTGLVRLEALNLKGVTTLRSFSDEFINLPRLKRVDLAKERRYLCCAFKYKRKHNLHMERGENVNFTRNCATISFETTPQATNSSPATQSPMTTKPSMTTQSPMTTKPSETNGSSRTTTVDPWGGWGRKRRALLSFGDWVSSPNKSSADSTKTNVPHIADGNFGTHTVKHVTAIFRCRNDSNVSFVDVVLEPVDCYPEPDPLRPCDDIMGNVYLTSISWIVSFLAIITNGIVFGILVMSRRQFTVTKFLIVNLAFADLCLGLYLFVLTCASIDSTGKYYNSVYSWQYDGGCDVVGFLAVFSSELSMLVLTIITIERYLAIVYAVYLQKRLRLRHARYLTAAAWTLAIIMAALPLVGVNSYQEVAICLPFRASTSVDIMYLALVFGCNSLLFLIIISCYIKIYLEVAGPFPEGRPPSQSNDSSVAKRIALLVFTDFACWLPIAIIGIIAAAGYSDSINMTVEKSKYLLVIFFPINSICNPFLYALSTRTFQREFFTVLAQCGYCQERLHKYNTNTYTSRKAQNKTGTYNSSLMDSANSRYTLKNGTLPVSGTSESKNAASPSRDKLVGSKNEGSSTQNNNQVIVHNVVPVHLVSDSNPASPIGQQIPGVVPPLERATSRTPLCEDSMDIIGDIEKSAIQEVAL